MASQNRITDKINSHSGQEQVAELDPDDWHVIANIYRQEAISKASRSQPLHVGGQSTSHPNSAHETCR